MTIQEDRPRATERRRCNLHVDYTPYDITEADRRRLEAAERIRRRDEEVDAARYFAEQLREINAEALRRLEEAEALFEAWRKAHGGVSW